MLDGGDEVVPECPLEPVVREGTPGEHGHQPLAVAVAFGHHLKAFAEPDIVPVLTDPRTERRTNRGGDRFTGIHRARRTFLPRRPRTSGSSPAQ
jgi:hypothetical protein